MTYDTAKEAAELQVAVFAAVGQASLCWKPTPEGVFDAAAAAKIGNDLLKFVMAAIERRDQEFIRMAKEASND